MKKWDILYGTAISADDSVNMKVSFTEKIKGKECGASQLKLFRVSLVWGMVKTT